MFEIPIVCALEMILEGSKKILANDIGSRIILTVLSSKISSIAALAGSCLGNFFFCIVCFNKMNYQ